MQPSDLDTGCAPRLGLERTTTTQTAPSGLTLTKPRALAFHPLQPEELWVVDADSSSVVVIDLNDEGHSRQLKDRAKYHYMAKSSSISFDKVGQFATCQESLNDYEGQMMPNFFMGPTLYDSRISMVNAQQEPCEEGQTCFLIHVDMLHESPLCMGIAHDDGAAPYVSDGGTEYKNVYWTFDGGSGQLVRYDFQSDHGPGSMDHSYAEVRRYTGIQLTRSEDVPSHMVVDPETRELFVCDSGADRLLIVNVDSGHFSYNATDDFPIYSSPASNFMYTVWDGLEWSIGARIPKPSGIAMTRSTYFAHYVPSYLYISSYDDGSIYAYQRNTGQVVVHKAVSSQGLTGLAVHPATGQLWYVNQLTGAIGNISVTTECTTTSIPSCTNGVISVGETDVDCGGSNCARCENGKRFSQDSDCAGGSCTGEDSTGVLLDFREITGICEDQEPVLHTAQFLWSYLNSSFYAASFAHHLAFGDMGGASYANPFPIMEEDFCDEVGREFSETDGFDMDSEVSCDRVDFDSLLLGGCWCHMCLPEDPCLNGGTCSNYNTQGYTCSCLSGFTGDHCQFESDGSLDATFPWFQKSADSLPEYALSQEADSEPEPETFDGISRENEMVLIAAAAGGGGGGLFLLLCYLKCCRGKRKHIDRRVSIKQPSQKLPPPKTAATIAKQEAQLSAATNSPTMV